MRQLWFSLGLVPVCLIHHLQPPCTRLVAEPVELPAWPRAAVAPRRLRRGSGAPRPCAGSLLGRLWIGEGGGCVREADLEPALGTGLWPGRYRDRDRCFDTDQGGAPRPSRRGCL